MNERTIKKNARVVKGGKEGKGRDIERSGRKVIRVRLAGLIKRSIAIVEIYLIN